MRALNFALVLLIGPPAGAVPTADAADGLDRELNLTSAPGPVSEHALASHLRDLGYGDPSIVRIVRARKWTKYDFGKLCDQILTTGSREIDVADAVEARLEVIKDFSTNDGRDELKILMQLAPF